MSAPGSFGCYSNAAVEKGTCVRRGWSLYMHPDDLAETVVTPGHVESLRLIDLGEEVVVEPLWVMEWKR